MKDSFQHSNVQMLKTQNQHSGTFRRADFFTDLKAVRHFRQKLHVPAPESAPAA